MISELRKTGNLEEYRYKINEIIKHLNSEVEKGKGVLVKGVEEAVETITQLELPLNTTKKEGRPKKA